MLTAKNITVSYGKTMILRDVSLRLKAGEIVALMGPNGAGKTSLMKALAGVVRVEGGAVTSDARIGWVPQGSATYDRLTVRENLELFARLKAKQQVQERVLRAAKLVDLDDRLDTKSRELSGGLRQRLSLAIGLLPEPDILLLDEPTTGIDLEQQSRFTELLKRLSASGVSILSATHSLTDLKHADRLVLLFAGEIVFSGSPAAVENEEQLVKLWRKELV